MAEITQAFFVGLLSAATPCLLPLYPAFIAYLTANATTIAGQRLAGLLGGVILAGVLCAMVVVALVITVLALPLGSVLQIAVPFADAAVIVLGVGLLVGRNPFERLPGARVPTLGNPFGQAFVYGLLLGPLALPCAGPFLVALLVISTDVVDAGIRLFTFVAFGLGFGAPLVALSLATTVRQQALVRAIVSWRGVVDRVGGVLLVAIGLAGLAGTLPTLLPQP